MALKVYNVLTKKKEEFRPENRGKVKMYACGITVSDHAHIGHAYQAIVFDMIRKYLEYIGYRVVYVRNYTDVDDKIIDKARELKVDPREYAEKLIHKTDHELYELEIKPPSVLARATECIDEMIEFIEKLIAKGHAYATDTGDVYFDVKTFPRYGQFSNRDLNESVSGVRKEIEPGKRNEQDFALWKRAGSDEIYWESPWGRGRPGWHIECSAMSIKYLGETLDIHGGGQELLFPHHENEIAQSEALTGKQFARYWLHNGLVYIDGQKMSKSLGNSILLETMIKDYNKEAIRLMLLQNNYRSNLNLLPGMFEKAEAKLYHIYQLFRQVDKLGRKYLFIENNEILQKIDQDFQTAMNNDFNTPVVFANLFYYIKELEKIIKEERIQEAVNLKESLIRIYGVLGLFQQEPNDYIIEIKDKYLAKNNIDSKEVRKLIAERKKLKENNEFEQADQIREQLLQKGIVLKDSKEKTDWDVLIK